MMSNKGYLEEVVHKLEKEIEADEAWIEYIETQVDGNKEDLEVVTRSVHARIDEMEAKIDDCIRIVEQLGRALDAFRP